MAVFFFVNKSIFPEGEAKKKEAIGTRISFIHREKTNRIRTRLPKWE